MTRAEKDVVLSLRQQQYSFSAIAETIGLPLGTIKSFLSRVSGKSDVPVKAPRITTDQTHVWLQKLHSLVCVSDSRNFLCFYSSGFDHEPQLLFRRCIGRARTDVFFRRNQGPDRLPSEQSAFQTLSRSGLLWALDRYGIRSRYLMRGNACLWKP